MAFNTKSPQYAEKLRNWKLSRAAHKLKNRSSKHLRFINTGKSIYRCLSGEVLQKMANNDNFTAYQEILRRQRKKDKKLDKAA